MEITLNGVSYPLSNTFGTARKIIERMDIFKGKSEAHDTWQFYEELAELLYISAAEYARKEGEKLPKEQFMQDFADTDIGQVVELVTALRKLT